MLSSRNLKFCSEIAKQHRTQTDGQMTLKLTGDSVLVTVALTDANKEASIFVLGGQQQLLSFHTVYVSVVPPASRDNSHTAVLHVMSHM